MIKEALQYLMSLKDAKQIELGGRKYTDGALAAVKPPMQSDLTIATLTGIADYFNTNPDDIDLKNTVVHIKNHKQVNVVSAVTGEWIQRHQYLTAVTEPKQFAYGRYMPLEDFIVSMQTYFVQDEITAKLMQMAGNLTDETSVKVLDDGVTQQVQAKMGIRIENVQLPNPVSLAPYRTFTQIEQPASAFVFRLKKSGGPGEGPTAALFDADGGNWQNDAIMNIKEWLREKLPEGTTILA
jgi:hypothetical protein